MIHWAKPFLSGDEEKVLVDAIHSSWISGGPYVTNFEKDFGEIIKSKNVLTNANCTTSLNLALLGLGIGPGDEVIVPDFTFVAPGNTTLQVGAKPVYVDVDKDTWGISPEEIKKAITTKTKAIIAVHLYGNVCEMDKIMEIAKKNNLYVVEDVAEAVFSKYNGKYAGTFGDVGCFSFQAAKTIAMGEGGAVVTDNDDLAAKMKKIMNHGMTSKRYWHDTVGYNYRLTNLQAALGYSQLKKLELILKNRERIYKSYREKLEDVDGITFQFIPKEVEMVACHMPIKIDPKKFKGDRDFLIEKLLEKGIETRPGFYPFSVMPFYNAPKFPIAEDLGANILVLPCFTSLTEQEIDYICKELINLKRDSLKKGLEVPLPEIIDRISITKLKIERVGEPSLQKEMEEYQKALKEFEDRGVKINSEWINELYEANKGIWDLEWDVREVVNSEDVWEEAERRIGFEELGRRLLLVEELMRKRVEIKNKITGQTGSGFKEKKINHCAS